MRYRERSFQPTPVRDLFGTSERARDGEEANRIGTPGGNRRSRRRVCGGQANHDAHDDRERTATTGKFAPQHH
jgi:hypothetical protein